MSFSITITCPFMSSNNGNSYSPLGFFSILKKEIVTRCIFKRNAFILFQKYVLASPRYNAMFLLLQSVCLSVLIPHRDTSVTFVVYEILLCE